MTLAEACSDGWTPGNVFCLIVGLVLVAGWLGLLDRWGER